MKVVAAVMALGGLLLAGLAVAADQDFTVVNKTGKVIAALYVSPTSANEWGEDILGVDTVAVDGTCDITFDPGEETALWDLRIEDADGQSIVWTGLKLKEISTATLHYENGVPTATIE
jgi:hypothetical protein